MKEPGLEGRTVTKIRRNRQKRSDTPNKDLPVPISEFLPNAQLGPCETREMADDADTRNAQVYERLSDSASL